MNGEILVGSVASDGPVVDVDHNLLVEKYLGVTVLVLDSSLQDLRMYQVEHKPSSRIDFLTYEEAPPPLQFLTRKILS